MQGSGVLLRPSVLRCSDFSRVMIGCRLDAICTMQRSDDRPCSEQICRADASSGRACLGMVACMLQVGHFARSRSSLSHCSVERERQAARDDSSVPLIPFSCTGLRPCPERAELSALRSCMRLRAQRHTNTPLLNPVNARPAPCMLGVLCCLRSGTSQAMQCGLARASELNNCGMRT